MRLPINPLSSPLVLPPSVIITWTAISAAVAPVAGLALRSGLIWPSEIDVASGASFSLCPLGRGSSVGGRAWLLAPNRDTAV